MDKNSILISIMNGILNGILNGNLNGYKGKISINLCNNQFKQCLNSFKVLNYTINSIYFSYQANKKERFESFEICSRCSRLLQRFSIGINFEHFM